MKHAHLKSSLSVFSLQLLCKNIICPLFLQLDEGRESCQQLNSSVVRPRCCLTYQTGITFTRSQIIPWMHANWFINGGRWACRWVNKYCFAFEVVLQLHTTEELEKNLYSRRAKTLLANVELLTAWGVCLCCRFEHNSLSLLNLLGFF